MRYRWAADIAWDEADGRVVVLEPRSSKMLTLNPVGSVIWRYLEAPRALDAIVDHLVSVWPDVARTDLEADASTFLARLLEAGTIAVDSS